MKKKTSFSALQMDLFGGDFAVIDAPVVVPKIISEKKEVVERIEQAFDEEVKSKRKLFELLDRHLVCLGSDRTKVLANIRAIEILQSGTAAKSMEEKEALVAYSGWGGLSNVFAKNTDFPVEQQRLRALLGEDAYASAMESVLSAYYTEPAVVRAIWKMVRHMGFAGGRVLEPSCGVGHFIGAMPQDLRQESHISMVEIDDTTAAIARSVYADEQTIVYHTGLQDAPIQPDSFDLVIGNVPFGNYRVTDRKFDHLRLVIHDYFFAKCLSALRVGGIMCLITSTGTMDKEEHKFREYLAQRANLLTAIRLPTGAFKRLGSTDVVADILVFQKKEYQPEVKDFNFGPLKSPPPQMQKGYFGSKINIFFASNENNVLGALETRSARFGTTTSVVARENWMQELEELAISQNLRGRFDPALNVRADGHAAIIRDKTGIKTGVAYGYFFDDDGQLMQLDECSEVKTLSHLPTGTLLRLEGMTHIRNAVLEVLEADSMQCASAAAKREKLNRYYDAFVKRHGFLMTAHNRRLFSADTHAPLLWSLEMYDEEKETAVKADIFYKSTVSQAVLAESAETMGEAIALSYNKFAKFVPEFVAKVQGRQTEDILEELISEDRVYLNPLSLKWEDKESYLSGNVYEKLDVAQAAQVGDSRFERNVAALKAVVPTRIPLRSVAVRLGVPWIGAEIIEGFTLEIVGINSSRISITHLPSAASWTVTGHAKKDLKVNTEWGTTRRSFMALLEDLLNQKTTEIYDKSISEDGKVKMILNADETLAAREKAEKIQNAFAKWVFASEKRVAKLEDIYNRTYNGRVNRSYDGSHLIIPGLNPEIKLRAAQKDSIWRGLVSGNTLYALAVGGGKTLIQICVAHESKRLGIANKPMLVVPNHMLEAFAGEYLRAFPRAKILAASKEDLQGERRKTLLMRAATHEWDCIIITHSSFGRLTVGTRALDEFCKDIGNKVQESIMGATDDNAVREAIRQKKLIEEKLKKMSEGEKDTGMLTFEQLGVDLLCVDEADLFKNLWFHTKKTRVAGLSNTCSGRALDLYLKSRMIFQRRNFDGFGLMFATATPIANTIAEMFIMQTYLQPLTLEKKGIDSFDAWAANFAREVTSIEVKPEGSGFRMHTRFARFVNVPELMLLFREIAEIRTKKDLALPEPTLAGGKHTLISVPASDEQKKFVQSLVERAELIRSGEVKPNEDNMLCVTNDGRKAALDMRCMNPMASDNPQSKVNACVEKVFQHWRDGQQERLTQLVFSDLSVPSNTGFSVYGDIRQKLIERGVPAQEIAFAQDYSTDKAKAELHRKVRQGMVRVLIGSTELMGFGTNVQDRLVAKHDLDAPWRPRDVEQRDGRIIRQKNKNEVVWIYRYVTEQTFDAYMWQTLERKAGFIAQVMEHTGDVRSVEDVTSQALSFAEVKALASGNPLVIEKAGIDAEVTRLAALKSVYLSDKRKYASNLHHEKQTLEYRENLVHLLSADIDSIGDTTKVVVDGIETQDPLKAGKMIMQRNAVISAMLKEKSNRTLAICKIGNATLEVVDFGYKRTKVRMNSGSHDIDVPYGAENIATFLIEKSLEKQLREIVEKNLEAIEKGRDAIKTLTQRCAVPFEHENALNSAIARQEEIDASLEIDSQDMSLVTMTED